MHISWFGHSFFKIELKNPRHEEVIILIDPYQNQKNGMPRNLKADIALLSHGTDGTIALSGSPAVIASPGEYEIKGVMIYSQFLKRKDALVFQIEAEDMSLAHLGRLSGNGEKEISDELAEKLGMIDVLFVPVGGRNVLDSQQATTLVNQLEPRLVIPMCFNPPGGKDAYEPVDKFLKIMGQKEMAALPKLKLFKKELPQEETRIVVLEKV